MGRMRGLPIAIGICAALLFLFGAFRKRASPPAAAHPAAAAMTSEFPEASAPPVTRPHNPFASGGLILRNPKDLEERAAYSLRDRNVTVHFAAGGPLLVAVGDRRGLAWKMGAVGGRESRPEPLGVSPTLVNQYIGSSLDWNQDQRSPEKLIYRDVWPKIDVVYEPRPHGLEYSVIIHPGGDPNSVRFSYQGVEPPRLGASGELMIPSGSTTASESAPVTFQGEDGSRRTVTSAFRVHADGSFGFALGQYSPDEDLVIDPTLDYSTYLGWGYGHGVSGTTEDLVWLWVDSAGIATIVGSTNSDFPTTPGVFQPNLAGSNDFFVARLNASGTGLLWSTYLGGNQGELNPTMTVDGAGNVYVGGNVAQGFPVTAGAYNGTAGTGGVAVAKISSDGGTLVWSAMIAPGSPFAITVDGPGNVFIAGRTTSSWTTTPGAYDTTFNGNPDDGFVAKLSADGTTLVWSTFVGGNNTDWIMTLALDSTGNVVFGGNTVSTDLPATAGAYRTTKSGGSSTGFVGKLSADGSSLLWLSYFGGTTSGSDYLMSVAIDAGDKVVLYGYTYTTDFPTTPGAYSNVMDFFGRTFVSQLSADGKTLNWSTLVGAADNTQRGRLLVLDASGNAYVTGSTGQSSYPTTPGAYRATFSGGAECFATCVNAGGGSLGWSTFLGGSGSERYGGIGVDAAGAVYVAGLTTSFDLATTPGAFSRTFHGDWDAFVVKINPGGATLAWSTYLGGGFNDEQAWSAALDASGNVYLTGYTISADFPTTLGAYDTSFNQDPLLAWSKDVFVSKFDPSGSTLVWSTFLGGGNEEWGRGIAVDGSGKVYVTGYTRSTNFPTTPGAYSTALKGTQDAFVTVLAADGGSLFWSTYLGGTNSDEARSIAVDGSGNVYVTGTTYSTDFPTSLGALQTANAGGSDVFVTKINSDGASLAWSTYLGGTANTEVGTRIAIDGSGNAVIAGYSDGAGFPTTAGAFDQTYNGLYDGFVAKIASGGGSLLWSTYLGGTSNDFLWGLALDATGAVYVSGNGGTNFPTTAGAFNRTYTGAAVSKLSSDGTTLIWSTFLCSSDSRALAVDSSGDVFALGGPSNGVASKVKADGSGLHWTAVLPGSFTPMALALNGAGQVAVAGYTSSSSMVTTAGAYQTAYQGSYDVFVFRMTDSILSTVVNDGLGADIAFQASTTSASANWSGFGASIASYQTSVGTAPGATNTLPAFNVGSVVSSTRAALLTNGLTYYTTVTGITSAGFRIIGVSNGFIVDAQAPSAPAAPTASPSPSQGSIMVSWSAVTESAPGSGVASYTLQRSFNGGAFGAVASGIVSTGYADSGLPEGSYTYRVLAVDNVGNTSLPSPASAAIVVDSTPPNTLIDSHPSDPTGATVAAFAFSATEAGCTFEVRLDGGAWTPNGGVGTKSYSSLLVGTHTFDVRATDAAGNVDTTPASFTWTIPSLVTDGVAPIINGFEGPLALSNWTLSGGTSVAWAVDATPASMPGGPAFSGKTSLNYNNGTDYNTPGLSNSGTATSPAIDTSALGSVVRCRFMCNYQTDTPGAATDRRSILISTDGFASTLVNAQLSTTPGSVIAGPCSASGTWHEHVVSFSPAGLPVQVRFAFDSVDAVANGFAGWFVDDFDVSDLLAAALSQHVPGSGALIPVGGVVGGATVEIRAVVSNAATGSVRLEVEVQPVGTPFSGTPTASVTATGAGATLVVQLPTPGNGDYRWRARTVETGSGTTSLWTSFGMNPDTDADFVVNLPAGGSGGCGLTGLEAWVILGSAVLLRRLARPSAGPDGRRRRPIARGVYSG